MEQLELFPELVKTTEPHTTEGVQNGMETRTNEVQ